MRRKWDENFFFLSSSSSSRFHYFLSHRPSLLSSHAVFPTPATPALLARVSVTPPPRDEWPDMGSGIGNIREKKDNAKQNRTEQLSNENGQERSNENENASEGMMFRRFFDRVYRLKENSVTYCTVKNNINKAASLVIETVQIYQLTFFKMYKWKQFKTALLFLLYHDIHLCFPFPNFILLFLFF